MLGLYDVRHRRVKGLFKPDKTEALWGCCEGCVDTS
jgi:hypothetical protein